MNIRFIVNGSKCEMDDSLPLTYEEVCDLAGQDRTMLLTITYERAGGEKPEGSVIRGGAIAHPKEGMIVNAYVTGNA